MVEEKLKELGYTLPVPSAPAANYVPFVISGSLVYISGQLPVKADGSRVTGLVGGAVSIEEGQEAARLCALNILAQAKAAVNGDWNRIVRLVRLGGFVYCGPDFQDHPKVINGASDLLVNVLGDRGRHARCALGAPSLPFGTSVEIEALFEIK